MATADPDPNHVFAELDRKHPGLGLLARMLGILKDHADPACGVESLFERRAEFLVPLRVEHAEVQAATLDRYSDAFDALEFAILLCGSLEKVSRPWYHDDDEPYEFAGDRALAHLFLSGTLVAGEVLALMRAGYSTGALARWRALHETATRAEFISRAGSGEKVYETAERYLDHAEYCRVRQFREVEDLLRSIRRDPARPYREGTASFIDQLIAKYGKVFLNDYGWAHALLLDTSDDYKAEFDRRRRGRGPRFPDLERVVRGRTGDPHRWQLLYAHSHAAVHGAPDASISRDQQGRTIRLSGPQAVPMQGPGEATAHRLSDLAWAFHLPDDVLHIEDPVVGVFDELFYAITELAEMAERAFAAA